MLVRLIIDNYTSFGEKTEFNTLPGRQSRLKHHLYDFDGTNVLNLSAVYGANGAGKSNLVYALFVLSELITSDELPTELLSDKFKLKNELNTAPTTLGIEFINNGVPYIYAIKFSNTKILNEELYKSGLGKKDDELIFERIFRKEGGNEINLTSKIEKSEEGKVLKDVIIKSYKNKKSSFFAILNSLEHPLLEDDIKNAYNWFHQKLKVLPPRSYFGGFVSRFKNDEKFREFAKDLICSFNTGIDDMKIEKVKLIDFLGENEEDLYREIKQILLDEPEEELNYRLHSEETISITLEDETPIVHRFYFTHKGENNDAKFYLFEESDGTKRLFEYIPAFEEVINSDSVYVIDEIERSIHPSLVKQLIAKYSDHKSSKGQLIFTTHESNLLDQKIFRQDEIWFVEKDKGGNSKMYPLSDFKVHHTKDIQKGYLNGRYGAIPFTGNLKDLSWDKYEATG